MFHLLTSELPPQIEFLAWRAEHVLQSSTLQSKMMAVHAKSSKSFNLCYYFMYL